MTSNKALVLLGPTGAGKRTVAAKLVPGIGAYHVSWKQVVLGADVAWPTDRIRVDVLSGEQHLTQATSLRLLKDACAEIRGDALVVFTAFPSAVHQVGLLAEIGFTDPKFVFMEISNELCYGRLNMEYRLGSTAYNPSLHSGAITHYREIEGVIWRECVRRYGIASVGRVDASLHPSQVYADVSTIACKHSGLVTT